jgi:beta-ureidopropionase / N-carbamoyl-L-amino-acid hydrolase
VNAERFSALWRSLAEIGRDSRSGGYLRYTWSAADLACREWFVEEALDRDLEVEVDGNGNLWAWWGDSHADGAVITGSHLDSVPHGGAYDGPLGVVSALLAIDVLQVRRPAPEHPIGVVVFAEEEGSRFGVPCLGSRLLTGAMDPAHALALRDRDGIGIFDAMTNAGIDPSGMGEDAARLGRMKAFVELHVEQGRALADLDAPVGVASAIWPHARYRLDFTGQGNHAGTTRMEDRHDPMLTFAYTVLAANKEARLAGAHATMGRVQVHPNATNAIPPLVQGWLDARAADESTLEALASAVRKRAEERASRDGTGVTMVTESVSKAVEFDLGVELATALDAPLLPTGAGHDAGVLAPHVPTAMLFVRNPTGVSHAPEEHASDADCAAGVDALATVLEKLAWR